MLGLLFLLGTGAGQLVTIAEKACKVDFGLTAYLKISPGSNVNCGSKKGVCKGGFLTVQLKYKGSTRQFKSVLMTVTKAQHLLQGGKHEYQLWVETKQQNGSQALLLVFPLGQSNHSSTINVFDFITIQSPSSKKIFIGKHLLTSFANFIEIYLYETKLKDGTTCVVAVSKKRINYRKEQVTALAKIVSKRQYLRDRPQVILRTLAENSVNSNALQLRKEATTPLLEQPKPKGKGKGKAKGKNKAKPKKGRKVEAQQL